MTTTILGGLLVLAMSAPGPASAQADSVPTHPAIEAFATRLEADAAEDSVGALSAAVIIGDRIVWAGAYGMADRATGVPATTETIFRAGSITKVVTAAALMRLAEAGALGLDQAVAPMVPEIVELAGLQATARPITYRDLASHTAGLDREPSSSTAARGRTAGWARKVVRSVPLTGAHRRPGEAYHYSNIGYGILGLALQRVAERSFPELVAAEVLSPLGMTSTWFEVPVEERKRLAAGYVNLPDGTIDPRVPRAEHRGRGYKVPSEGLYTTAPDLARLAMLLSGALGDVLLDADARAGMLSDHDPDGDDRSGYGLGLQLTRVGDTLLAGHSGTAAGYSSYLVLDPATDVGVVILRSYNRGETNLAAEAQRLVLELAAGR